VSVLTYFGFMVKNRMNKYSKVENKLLVSAQKYAGSTLILEKNSSVTVTSNELIENGFLDELKYEDDVCMGYVIITYKNVYKYKSFIKCNDYKTRGY